MSAKPEDAPDFAWTATDPDWWKATGMCGGCGRADCHKEMCVGDRCRVCSTRKATGEVPS